MKKFMSLLFLTVILAHQIITPIYFMKKTGNINQQKKKSQNKSILIHQKNKVIQKLKQTLLLK